MTPEQIDRVLPRAATWPPRIYDMTDTDERREACEWVAGIANAAETPLNTEDDIRASIEWLRSLRQSRDSSPGSPESDENAEQVPVDPGNDTGETAGLSPDPELERLLDEEEAVHRAARRLGRVYGGWGDQWEVRDGVAHLTASNDWPPPPSWAIPTQPAPPAPGITYHGRDDER